MSTTLFELKEKMYSLQRSIQEEARQLDKMCKDYTTPIEAIKAKEAGRDALVAEFERVKAQHDEMEAKQMGIVKADFARSGSVDVKAKANFYRAAFAGNRAKSYTGLGAIPAADPDLGGGNRFLPTNMSSELITEPLVENPLRSIVRLSSVTGQEEPRLAFKLEGSEYDDVTDKETAKEIELKGDSVVYGRHKVKVLARVSDTVIHGTDTNLVTEIENGLRNGLAVNELSRMFAKEPGEGYKEMSFYSTDNAVKAIEGTTKQEAIAKALADLPMAYRRNARIVMSGADWYDMWKDNLNTSGTFYEERPLTLFGKPVVLVDEAVDPVVGDFSYARINYDIGAIYDTDKDVTKGEYMFVLTAWYDIKLRLSSAFRIAKVSEAV